MGLERSLWAVWSPKESWGQLCGALGRLGRLEEDQDAVERRGILMYSRCSMVVDYFRLISSGCQSRRILIHILC